MKAGIIAAGEGSRLRDAGIEVPKPMVRVGEMTLLERTLRALVQENIHEVAVIVNTGISQVIEYAVNLNLGLTVHAVIKDTPSSMHSLAELEPYLGDDRFILCTVDSIVLPAEFSDFVQCFQRNPEIDLLLSYTDYIDDEKPLHIGVDDVNRVTGLGVSAAASPFVTVGLYGMSPKVFQDLLQAKRNNMEKLRNFLDFVLKKGHSLRGYRLSKAIDVDRPEDILTAESFLNEHGLS